MELKNRPPGQAEARRAATHGAASAAPRVLIVAEHASFTFGGEAALPLHYFRVLRNRGIAVWLVTHARTRAELSALYPDDDHILCIEDTSWHRAMWRIGNRLPDGIAYLTTGFLSRLSTQLAQRRIVRDLVREHGITVVHQPMPVSPREPSMLFGFGVPVIIGPMNGGMEFPPAFRHGNSLERSFVRFARLGSTFLNWVMPGKRQARVLLVANARTRRAMPGHSRGDVIELVENGVDLSLWKTANGNKARESASSAITTFIFMGRLVDWKRVDLLVRAFARACRATPMRLLVVGGGDKEAELLRLAQELDVLSPSEALAGITFTGWLSQLECAKKLSTSDCLVLPSILECGGAVVLEAMAMGKPVIATAWGGPLDYLDPSCGILVEPDGADALIAGLSDAMVRIAGSPEFAAELGLAGRAKVVREYDWDVKVARVLDIYALTAHASGPA